MPRRLIAAHGGSLVDLIAPAARLVELKAGSRDWLSWDLTPRQVADLELLLGGGLSPLRGFMARADYESVCDDMRLVDGTLWPVPITLDVAAAVAATLRPGAGLALRDAEGVMLAVVHVEEVWQPDLQAEAERVLGSSDPAHPGVAALLRQRLPFYVGGRVEGVQPPAHYDFTGLWRTPRELRQEFERCGWTRVLAYQATEPMHRAQFEVTLRAAKELGANVLVHAIVGSSKPGDADHYARVRCFEQVMPNYPHATAMLGLLPLATRHAGPRDALLQAIVAQNHGCSHVLIGGDHGGAGVDAGGEPFYAATAALDAVQRHRAELPIAPVCFRAMVYVEEQDAYFPRDEVPDDSRVLHLSNAELSKRLAEGKAIPEWFTFPAVARTLQDWHKPRHRQGFTVFLTGLSGAGKSTIANALLVKLCELGGRAVTLLDGDVVRKHLSSELGFSKEHRNLNIRRIGYVASEITKNGGIAICAPIAPYDELRREVRRMIEPCGGFILVYVHTPLQVCEDRDRKGLYAKARAGMIKEFTGISDPYEEPTDADVVLETTELTPGQAAQQIVLHLERAGYVG